MQDAISTLQLDDNGRPSRNTTATTTRATTAITNDKNDNDNDDKDYEDWPALIDVEDSDNDDDDNFVSNTKAKRGMIYMFYKQVTTNANSKKNDGNQYFKCFDSNHKILKITAAMKVQSPDGVITSDEVNIVNRIAKMDTEAMAKYVLGLSRSLPPFTEVDRPEFCKLLEFVSYHSGNTDPLHIPHRTSMQQKIMKQGAEAISEMKEMFLILESKVSISLDAWTSSNQYTFLAIIAHYITNDVSLPSLLMPLSNIGEEKTLIDFKELIGEHSGDNMAYAVWETLEKYGLISHLCRIVRSVWSSPQRQKSWLNNVTLLLQKSGSPRSSLPLMLILDVKTHWSLTHQMICCALAHREILSDFIGKNWDLLKYDLMPAHWDAIALVEIWLRNFHATTVQMSATFQLMLSQTFAMLQGLQEILRDTIRTLSTDIPTQLHNVLVDSHLKLSEYYLKIDESSYYMCLAEDFEDSPELLKDLRFSKSKLKVYFNQHYKKAASTPLLAASSAQSVTSQDSESSEA
ncbi:Transposase protein [Salix suchowensis]|nr:Transposase protein [Salix suchowensis]